MLQGIQASVLGGRGVRACPCAHASSRRQLRLACRAQRGGGAASAVTDKLGSLFSKAAGKKAVEEEDRCAPLAPLALLARAAGLLTAPVLSRRFKYDFANSRWVRVKPERDADGALAAPRRTLGCRRRLQAALCRDRRVAGCVIV